MFARACGCVRVVIDSHARSFLGGVLVVLCDCARERLIARDAVGVPVDWRANVAVAANREHQRQGQAPGIARVVRVFLVMRNPVPAEANSNAGHRLPPHALPVLRKLDKSQVAPASEYLQFCARATDATQHRASAARARRIAGGEVCLDISEKYQTVSDE